MSETKIESLNSCMIFLCIIRRNVNHYVLNIALYICDNIGLMTLVMNRAVGLIIYLVDFAPGFCFSFMPVICDI